MRKLIVDEKFDNKKVSVFLMDTFKNLNINTIYKTLRKKDIRINDVKIQDNVIVHTGDEITVFITDDILFGNSINFKTIYEDDNILIVDKPSGIAVTESSNSEPTLTEIINQKFKTNNIKPCHRLDRNTSGLVLFAKNEEALNILFEAFKNKEIEKYYTCMVYGKMEKQSETLIAYLFKDNKKSKVYISKTPKTGYQKIITSYKVLSYDKKNNTSKLQIKLETGRTHQIRAHLASIGHPLIGDGKYGKNEINKKFKATTQILNAYKITFAFSSKNMLSYLNEKTFGTE